MGHPRFLWCAVVLSVFILVGELSAQTVVRFGTSLGTFDVRLFDGTAPLTVQNFLNYVNDGDYDDSFFHRLVPGFVLQGGGFAFYPDADGNDTFHNVPTDDPIPNEFNISNTRGTIAMAKEPSGPDTATSQFFFNLADNSTNLDNQNGGFTVFGEVIDDGMEVLELLQIQATVWNANAIHTAFSDLPLIDYTVGQPLGREHLEMINSITVVPELPTALVGDVDLSGFVDYDDLTVLLDNWGVGVEWGQGDFNEDTRVDDNDLSLLLANWHTGIPPMSGQAVPEPAALSLLGIGGFVVLIRRRG